MRFTIDTIVEPGMTTVRIVLYIRRGLMPPPSTDHKIVCAGPKFLCQKKICLSQTFCVRSKDDLHCHIIQSKT